HALGDTSDPALPRISRRQLRNVAICARSADVAALAVLLGRRLNSKPASRPVLEQRFELHVACRDLSGRLASREDGKELAEAMPLELKLETHARARLPNGSTVTVPTGRTGPAVPRKEALRGGSCSVNS